MSHSWGYTQGKKMAKEIGLSSTPIRVEVKTHTRAPRMPKAPMRPTAPSKDTPKQPGMACGGAVKGYAKGGAVHSDVKQDKAMVKSMVKPTALKGMAKGGKWIASATQNKGGLHKSLGIAAGKKIPAKTLAKAATKGGKVGKQARLAETLKSFKK